MCSNDDDYHNIWYCERHDNSVRVIDNGYIHCLWCDEEKETGEVITKENMYNPARFKSRKRG